MFKIFWHSSVSPGRSDQSLAIRGFGIIEVLISLALLGIVAVGSRRSLKPRRRS